MGVTALLWLQIALGGWVSTNYAVLACSGFPQCNGQWWPAMNMAEGFTLLRELGRNAQGVFVSFEALVAIHMVHRLVALLLVAGVVVLLVALRRQADPALRRVGLVLGLVMAWQVVSALSNVVLGWPLVAALAHTAGAAALVAVMTSLLWRGRSGAPVAWRAAPGDAVPA